MHCGHCGNTSVEVRPCYIECGSDVTPRGDAWVCQTCASELVKYSLNRSDFSTWLGVRCDECGVNAAFDGPIEGMPEGIVCDQCGPITERGIWLCISCYERTHYGHRQKQLQPILERLSRL